MKISPAIRVVIADDHSIVREGLMAVINSAEDMEVIAEARSWPEAIEKILEYQPAIAVLDLHMRGMEPADGIAVLREKTPGTQIIIFSAFGTDEEVFQVLRAGARGYIFKGESSREDLLTCIRAVSGGEMWVHPIAAARLAERMTTQNLTSREVQVLRLMVVGKSNKEIGSSLSVTEGTVKVHVTHILAKLGASGRVEAIMVAAQRGLVPLLESLQDPADNFTNHDHTPLASHVSGGNISKVLGSANSTSQLQTKK
jgi:DNA-binding NarL/FixJ family response regulator